MSNEGNNYGCVGFIGLLTIVFIVLKLTKIISWSWWLVLSPTLIWFAICFAVVLAAYGYVFYRLWKVS